MRTNGIATTTDPVAAAAAAGVAALREEVGWLVRHVASAARLVLLEGRVAELEREVRALRRQRIEEDRRR